MLKRRVLASLAVGVSGLRPEEAVSPTLNATSCSLRRAWRAAVLGLIAALSLFGAASAQAAVPGLELVQKNSEWTTAKFKNAVAKCPTGKRVVGTGAAIHGGGGGRVLIDDMVATSATTVSASAIHHSGETTAWYVTAHAICADPLPGSTIVTGQPSASTPSNKSMTVSCPPGKRVVGTGGDLLSSNGQAFMNSIVPNETLTSVTVIAHNRATAPYPLSDWSLRAHAICADPLPGLMRTSVTSYQSAEPFHSATVECAGGRRLLGAGAEIVNGQGLAVLTHISPVITLAGLHVIGYKSWIGAPFFAVRGYGICAS